MKIFVLGAGRMGSVVAQDLSRSENRIEIGIGDLELDRAQALSKAIGCGTSYKVDVTKLEGVANVLKGYDTVVNASWYEFNLHVMRACLKARCHYNDLGGLFHMTRKQLELDSSAKCSGISAIVGGGESPGITNVMCSFAAEDYDEIDSVRIFVGAKEESDEHSKTSNQPFFPFSVATVIDEYSKNPVEFLDGNYVEMPPLSGDETVHFPAPVGDNVCHYSLHSEPATLPRTIGRGVKNVEFKLGVSSAMLSALKPLIELGFTSDDPIPINGAKISPKQFLVSYFNSKSRQESPARTVALKTLVSGSKRGKNRFVTCDLVYEPTKILGISNATAYLTGVAGSVFGQFLSTGRVKEKGVLAPEEAVDTKQFFKELETRGIRVSKSELS
jgi:saccharopine dehydrogenase-like NADP-dependent oxidoreductase